MAFPHAGHYGVDSLTFYPSGQVLPPGTIVAVLVGGTATPAALYSDRDWTPLGGPARVDATGNFGFYAAAGDYDLRVGSGPSVRVTAVPLPEDVNAAPVLTLQAFGGIPDGTFDPDTFLVTGGTDNTGAINAALATGRPVLLDGFYYYADQLFTDTDGSGLVGIGPAVSGLITDQNLGWHLSVVEGTTDTRWTGFSMIGPHDESGPEYNRALVIGADPDLVGLADDHWDASGTWIDDVVVRGYRAGLHPAHADHVRFGSLEVYEVGDSKAEPGSYGITCSGSYLHGQYLRAENATSVIGRHALYYNGLASYGFVEHVEADGWDFPAVQNRATTGGGAANGFGDGSVFRRCNLNESDVEPVTTQRGVVYFATAGDVDIDGAGGCRIGDYTAIDCGGMPGPSIRHMPNTKCGSVTVYGHNGEFIDDHYGAHVFHSPRTRMPALDLVTGFGADGINDSALIGMRVEDSDGCYGGAVRMHAGAVLHTGWRFDDSSQSTAGDLDLNGCTYTYGLRAENTVGLRIDGPVMGGTYLSAVRWDGTSDNCDVSGLRTVTEPTSALVADNSTGLHRNLVMRAPGYDLKEITTGTTTDAAGYRVLRLNYSVATTLVTVTGIQQGAELRVVSLNANATITYDANDGGMDLSGGANRLMGTRTTLVLAGHVTGTTSPARRWIESDPKIALAQLVPDTATAVGVGSLNIGHATDTTLSRLSAGLLGVEGLPLALKVAVPASAGATGVVGQWALDSSFVYFCTAANTWVRAAVATW